MCGFSVQPGTLPLRAAEHHVERAMLHARAHVTADVRERHWAVRAVEIQSTANVLHLERRVLVARGHVALHRRLDDDRRRHPAAAVAALILDLGNIGAPHRAREIHRHLARETPRIGHVVALRLDHEAHPDVVALRTHDVHPGVAVAVDVDALAPSHRTDVAYFAVHRARPAAHGPPILLPDVATALHPRKIDVVVPTLRLRRARRKRDENERRNELKRSTHG
jgi:hypothetical protein